MFKFLFRVLRSVQALGARRGPVLCLSLLLTVVAPQGSSAAVAELGSAGAAVVAQGAQLFVSLPLSEQVAVIDAAGLVPQSRIALPGGPQGLALADDGATLLVALARGHGFARINLATKTVTRHVFTLPPGVLGFEQVADMGHGRVLLHSSAAPTQFAVFDASAPDTLQWSAALPRHDAHTLAYDRVRQRLYTTRAGHFITLDFNVATAPVVLNDSAQLSDGTPLAARQLRELRYDAANDRVVSGDGLVFDPVSLTPQRDFKRGQRSVLSADGRYLFSANNDGRLMRSGLRNAADDRTLPLACELANLDALVVMPDGESATALAGAQLCSTVTPAERRAMLAATVAPTVPSPLDLYPMHRSAEWTYKNADGSPEIDTVVGSTTINGHPVWKILYNDNTFSFRQVIATEASEVRSTYPADKQVATSVPPNLLVKSTDQIGKSYVQTGNFEARTGSEPLIKIKYKQTRKIVGFTNVKLAFGTYRALRIDYTITQTFQGQSQTGSGSTWLVPGMGEVQSGATGKPTTKLINVTVDRDKDGVTAKKDNCLLIKNADQRDTDKDKQGNACDKDDDGDGVADTVDNCPLVKNATQLDTDADGAGDACDTTP